MGQARLLGIIRRCGGVTRVTGDMAMNWAAHEGTSVYLSSARHRLSEAESMLMDAGVTPSDSSFALIQAADAAITDLQRAASMAGSEQQ